MGSVLVYKNGVFVGPKRSLDFIEGTNVTLTITDDPTGVGQTNIEIAAAGGAGAGGIDNVTFGGNVV